VPARQAPRSRSTSRRPVSHRDRRADPSAAAADTLAQRLHGAAIHLLRRLRAEDAASGLTAPRASALSVLVFAGPRSIGELAAAEQVRPPTISRLVQELERDGLVRREADRADARVQRVHATAAGEALLQAGRARRVARLAESLRALPAADRRLLERAAPLLEALARPAESAAPAAPARRSAVRPAAR
jgi:DNA-binding MarR family transcriptional regulator